MLETLFPTNKGLCDVSKQLKSQPHYKKKIVDLVISSAENDDVLHYKIPNDFHFLADVVYVLVIPADIHKNIRLSETEIKNELKGTSLFFDVVISETFDFDVVISGNQILIKPKWAFKENAIPLFYINQLSKYLKMHKISLKNICKKLTTQPEYEIPDNTYAFSAYGTFINYPEDYITYLKAINHLAIVNIKTIHKINSVGNKISIPKNILISKIRWNAFVSGVDTTSTVGIKPQKIAQTKFDHFFNVPGILTMKKDYHEYVFSSSSSNSSTASIEMCALTHDNSVLEILTQTHCDDFCAKIEVNQIITFKDNTLIFPTIE